MKNCKHCGAEIRDGARFCIYCLTSFEEKALVLPRKKSNTPFILTSSAALLLAIAMALSYVAFGTRERLPEMTTDAVPSESAPIHTTPEQTTPEQTTPEQTNPEQTTPEQTTPEQTTPEQTTPEPVIPEGYIPIYDKYDFDAIRNAPDQNYILMSDIYFEKSDFTEGGAFYNGKWGWSQIRFSGILDGNGKALKNFQYASGILSPFQTNSGTIMNLGIEGRRATFDSANGEIMGGMIVLHNTGSIINCYNEVDVIITCSTRSNVWMSGIACQNFGSIRKCANYGNITVDVTSTSAGPRIAGIAVDMKCEALCLDQVYEIVECYNGGNIYVNGEYSNEVAGIVACCECLCSKPHSYGRCVIKNCYNTGRITSPRTCFGIVGNMWAPEVEEGEERIVVENVYNSGYVTAILDASFSVGVTAGHFEGIGFVSCYYLKDASNHEIEAGVMLTSEQMAVRSSFEGFDFENVWYIDEEGRYAYPQLICFRED